MNQNNKENLIFLGDIHGEFKIVPYLLRQKQIKDSVIIQVGDFGIGFYKDNYYKNELKQLNKKLVERNIHLYAIRGNHDNPAWFKETHNPFDYSNITLLADYSELDVLGNKILCCGGATSIDAITRTENVDWWKDEKFFYNDFFSYKEYDIVCTHCRPLVSSPSGISTNRIKYYLEKDKELYSRLRHEGMLLDLLYNKTQPKFWFHGHYHESYINSTPSTRFRCLDINELFLHNQY